MDYDELKLFNLHNCLDYQIFFLSDQFTLLYQFQMPFVEDVLIFLIFWSILIGKSGERNRKEIQ